MSDNEWFNKRRKNKIVKLLFILLLSYMLYATFFDFKVVIWFFGISLILGVILTVIEIVDIVKRKNKCRKDY